MIWGGGCTNYDGLKFAHLKTTCIILQFVCSKEVRPHHLIKRHKFDIHGYNSEIHCKNKVNECSHSLNQALEFEHGAQQNV